MPEDEPKLKLYGRSNAYNVQKVLWLLVDLDLPFEHIDIGRNEGDLDSDEFVALNPHRRVPLLVDAGNIVWESNTILRYLARQYGQPHWIPADPLLQSNTERWMDWELTKLQPAFIDLFWGFYRCPAQQRDLPFIEQAKNQCANHIEILDQQLKQNSYLAGDEISLADIVCGTCLHRYFEMGVEVAQPVHIKDWYQRLLSRDGYKRWISIPFDELKGRTSY